MHYVSALGTVRSVQEIAPILFGDSLIYSTPRSVNLIANCDLSVPKQPDRSWVEVWRFVDAAILTDGEGDSQTDVASV